MENKPPFNENNLPPIGYKYIFYGKSKRETEVIDIHTTYNLKKEIVNVRLVTRSYLLGQEIINPENTFAEINRSVL